MNRRIQLWLGVSACALLGVTALPATTFAGSSGGQQGNSHDIDPDGGMRNECGEAGGCAEAGESFESRTLDEMGEEGSWTPTPTAQPRSHGHGLGDGDSVSGRLGGGSSLGGSSGGLGH
jgi:hypothetical protein